VRLGGSAQLVGRILFQTVERARARTSGDSQFAGFTFDREMNGVLVGEQGDNRELFLLRVEANEVTKDILRRGDPVLPWEPGYRGLDDRPWLVGERPWRSSLDSPAPELEQIPLPQSPRARRIENESVI
jgi:hypothetical protein